MPRGEEPGGVTIGNVEGGIHGSIISGGDVTIHNTPSADPERGAPQPQLAEEYDLAAIRRLLLAAFTAQTLRRFCQDRRIFRPVVADFGPGSGLNDMVDRVIDYCETRLLFDELLAEVKNENPSQYAVFESVS